MLWDAGDGGVKGFGLRVSAQGGRSFILMYRAGKGRAAPLRKVTIGPFGSPWTVETAPHRGEAHPRRGSCGPRPGEGSQAQGGRRRDDARTP